MLHCLRDGFNPTYKNWTGHGEIYVPFHSNEDGKMFDSRDNMAGMLHDAMGISNKNMEQDNDQQSTFSNLNGADEETKNFIKLLRDAETPLFQGCKKQTKLSFIARLLQLKVLCRWTNHSVDLLLELLKDSFPDDVNLPANCYEATKITTELGFTCKIIDACHNNCMLFRGEDEKLDKCEICGGARYVDDVTKIAKNQMRYFPLKPRLQKLFMSSKTSSLMRWHAEKRIDDGILRHPADSQAWKNFDERNPTFASDIRNVRLGLATDGFNPFGTMNVSNSIWPVVLLTYNLPPWLCMKQPSLILSIIIDGPKGPGNKIDVFLQPLIDELKELWDIGVQTYDASADQVFQLHAALLWTISDFPGYGNISGWSTKGMFACPNCGKDTQSKYLKNGHKFCYCGHRRFLPTGHRLRRDRVSFDGTIELRQKPTPLSVADLLRELETVPTEYKKEDVRKRWMQNNTKKRKVEESTQSIWKKRSIFFELPYWAGNLIRHNLDVMHIEKNVCDNVLFTLLGVKGKTKDNLNARKDLQLLKIRSSLHPIPRRNGALYLPAASFTMSKHEKNIFCGVLKRLRPPDGYASNISRHVQLEKQIIWGLKSHDNHVLMQKILPIAARRALPKNVVDVLIELSNFFRTLCSKMNSVHDLEKLQDRIVLTLCHLEKIFPPSFFDIMEHLPVHLAEEAKIAGPVQFRWMYPIERYLSTLKKYVRNRAHPEGSIARGYLMEECMNFCSRYLNDVETKENRLPRNYDGNNLMGRRLFSGKRSTIDKDTLLQIHRYVLANADTVAPYRDMHQVIIKREKPRATPREIQFIHSQTFYIWFKAYVQSLQEASDPQLTGEIIALANGPIPHATKYNACIIGGYRYRVKSKDIHKKTQCSGVVVNADTLSFASAKDKKPRSGNVSYYGVLTDIIDIQYTKDIQFLMFKCDWVDNERGVKQDEFKFTLVNFNYLMYERNLPTDEPFILATQSQQVWYIADPVESDWNVVVKMSRRDSFDIYSTIEAEKHSSLQLDDGIPNRNEDVCWVREGVEGVIVDAVVGTVDHNEIETDMDVEDDLDE
ncbi:PREDICTED: uncharacterized protein LOC105966882 [Erythranthe guttata]|uniref:uncharacterized protein LOC105966882 n=1 Tax=Erythranthe guttata TaxID=4155 RepID=UPI00064DB15A|nr:PREDICTED: uncharacterized protein LOC105966882 [Erythranthe guttata]|eukprot:XP_012846911.1 PREDICTED: uncharacterized protein LOC105966882 [Erythranthe guttata]